MLLGATRSAAANPHSDVLRARAANKLYNLDYERAIGTYREAIAADADDAAAERGLPISLWMGETLRLGTLTIDSYLGGVTRANVKLPPAPPAAVAEFQKAIERAVALARSRLAADPRNAGAYYEFGRPSVCVRRNSATIQSSLRAAFGSAREAYNAHEKVLELDPRRRDAGLVAGTYRYTVAALSLPLRWAAYVAGFGGGREKGLRLVEAAAGHVGDNQTDARLALVLLYNRERRY